MPETQFSSATGRTDRCSVLLEVTRESAGWEFLDFSIRRIPRGLQWRDRTDGREACLVLLSGECEIQLEGGPSFKLGPRLNVFAGYPHAAYLPSGTGFRVEASRNTELADGRAPSSKALAPRLIEPRDCGLEIRGGGNATRQIVDIMPPDFPGDRLLVCEVFTPSGNWSSFPPHKHDEENFPAEVDLEEVYYYRFSHPDGFGYQRLYRADGSRDETFRVVDGDLVLVREGYHPFVTCYGYHAYYLNFLAGEPGTRRSMAASDDPSFAHFRERWPKPDPRLPLLRRPEQT